MFAILKAKETGTKRKLIGFVLDKPGFPRKDYKVLKDGKEIGHVTSGTVSPILEKGIGLAYVNIEFSKIDTQISVNIRGKEIPAHIVKPPFV